MPVEIFLGLLVLFAVVTVVGHFSWVALRAIFRTLSGNDSGGPTAANGSPRPQIQNDLKAYERIIKYLRWKGWILPAELDHLQQLGQRVHEDLAPKAPPRPFQRPSQNVSPASNTLPASQLANQLPSASTASPPRADFSPGTGLSQVSSDPLVGGSAAGAGSSKGLSPRESDLDGAPRSGDAQVGQGENEWVSPVEAPRESDLDGAPRSGDAQVGQGENEWVSPVEAPRESDLDGAPRSGDAQVGHGENEWVSPVEAPRESDLDSTPRSGDAQVGHGENEWVSPVETPSAGSATGTSPTDDQLAEVMWLDGPGGGGGTANDVVQPVPLPVDNRRLTPEHVWDDPLAPTPPAPTRQPPSPRKPLGDMLAAFLAERNIRWGELAAGILIVVCSIGLVISLWSTLTETNRLLPAGVFLVAVAAIEAAGLYTLKRWKLRHTSRAVLMIATMLVPLSMMAGISIAGSGEDAVQLGEPLTMAAVAVGGLSCLGMLFAAGSALQGMPSRWAWSLALGLPTVSMPFASAAATRHPVWSPWLLLGSALAVAGTLAWVGQRGERRVAAGGGVWLLSPARRHREVMFVAMACYALAVLFALFVLRSGRSLTEVVPLLLALLPALVSLASATRSIAKRLTAGAYRVVLQGAFLTTLVGCLAILPPTMERFEWVTAYSVVLAASSFALGVWRRDKVLITIAPLAIACWLPLAIDVWMVERPWDAGTDLWRRYVNGNAVLALGVWTALVMGISVGLMKLTGNPRTNSIAQGLTRAGIFVGVMTIGLGLAVGIGPTHWLGQIPRAIIVSILACGTLGIAVFELRRGVPAKWSPLAVLLTSVSACLPWDLWWGKSFADWSPRLTLLLAISAGAALVLAEILSTAIRYRWLVVAHRQRSSLQTLRSWWGQAGIFTIAALFVAPFSFDAAQRSTTWLAVASVVILILAAARSRRARWIPWAQLASIEAGVMIVACWRPDWLWNTASWYQTDSAFLAVAIAAGVAIGWTLWRDLIELMWPRMARVARQDVAILDRWLAYLCLVVFTGAIGLNLARVLVSYVMEREPSIAQWQNLAIGAASVFGLAIARSWPLLVKADRLAMAATRASVLVRHGHIWLIVATTLPIAVCALLTVHYWGTGAQGVLGVAWSTLISATGVGTYALLRGRRVADALPFAELHLASVIGLATVVVGGATGALLLGQGGIFEDAETVAPWIAWQIATIGTWSGICLALASVFTHRVSWNWGAWLTTSATALIVSRLAMPEVALTFPIAIAVANWLTFASVARLAHVTGATNKLAAWGWPLRQRVADLGGPAKFGVLLSLGATLVVAMVETTGIIGNGHFLIDMPTLWYSLTLCACVATTSRQWQSWGLRVVPLIATWCISSGLLVSMAIDWQWIRPEASRWLLTTVWLAGGLVAGVSGVVRRQEWEWSLAFLITTVTHVMCYFFADGTGQWNAVAVTAACGNVLLGVGMVWRGGDARLGQLISSVGIIAWSDALARIALLTDVRIGAFALVMAATAAAWNALAGKANRKDSQIVLDLLLSAGVGLYALRPAITTFGLFGGEALSTWAFGLILASLGIVLAMASIRGRRANFEVGVVAFHLLVLLVCGWALPGGTAEQIAVVTSVLLGSAIALLPRIVLPGVGSLGPATPWRVLVPRARFGDHSTSVTALCGAAATFVALVFSAFLSEPLSQGGERAAASFALWVAMVILPLGLRYVYLFEPRRWIAASFALILLSGLLPPALTYWGWVSAEDAWWLLAGAWGVPALVIGVHSLRALFFAHTEVERGIAAPSGSANLQGCGWSAAAFSVLVLGLNVLFAVNRADQGAELAIRLATVLVGCVWGPLLYRWMRWELVGQLHSIAAACLLVWSVGVVINSSQLLLFGSGGTALVLLAMVWRLVCQTWLREHHMPSSSPSGGHHLSVHSGPLWIDHALIGAGLLLLARVSWMMATQMASNVTALEAVINSLGLAVIFLGAVTRFSSRWAVAFAYVASQLLVISVIGWLVPRDWWIKAYALEGTGVAILAGLWVWGWPLSLRPTGRRQTELDDNGLPHRAYVLVARHTLSVLIVVTAAVIGIGAAYVAIQQANTTSRWLLISALGGMGLCLGAQAGWFESFRPQVASMSLLMRRLATIVVCATLVISVLGPQPATEPWKLVLSMRLWIVAILVTPSALWLVPRMFGLDMDRWRDALRLGGWIGMGIGAGAMPVMFAQEWLLRGSTQLETVSTSLVIAVAVLIGVGAVVSAVLGLARPGTIQVLPSLTDTHRRLALYIAQALGGLAWLHVYLCRPELALAGLRPYWPYIVMGIAFLSAGITQWGRRRGDAVVGGTLWQTTMFLPLIPVIGFWLAGGSEHWVFGGDRVPYPMLLLVASLFYGGLAVLWRRDHAPRIAAIILGNGALWVILSQHPSLSIAMHPQFWLIPPAVCVLVATQMDRGQLKPAVLAAIRYAATLVIYVSSTADVLLGEIGATLWGPMLLITLALIGMAAGVALRTRAFLYLGTLFVLVGVLGMVWHAGRAIDQSWPWWVFGITVGLLILGGKMALEKNKQALHAWLERLNAWDS